MKYVLSLLALFALQLFYFKVADKFNIIDKPNLRSSHTKITLRGGGIVFYFGVLLYFLCFGFQYSWFFTGLTLIATISFLDDIKPQSPKLRLAVHFLAMLCLFYQWDLFATPWYFMLIALVICTGIINAFNFMDGINGLTGAYGLVLVTAYWYINNYKVAFVDNDLIYVVVLSLLTFLFFNFRKKAVCFAGDVGSVTIAFIVLFLLGLLVIQTNDFSYIVLLAVYGVDSVLTIIHRLMLRENIFEAHRKHAYQIMANELKMPHVGVSAIYVSLQAVIAVGLFVFESYKWLYVFIVIVILAIAYVLFMKKFFHLHYNLRKNN